MDPEGPPDQFEPKNWAQNRVEYKKTGSGLAVLTITNKILNFQVKSPTHSFASSSSGSYSVNNTENGKKISPPKETINGKPLPPIGTKPVTPPKPQTPPKPSKPQLGMATTEPLKPSEEPAQGNRD